MRYILFIKEDCPFCIKAVDALEQKELPHSIVAFEEGQDSILNEIKEAYDWKTVPMIFYRNVDHIEFIGGYTDLVEYMGNV